MLKLINLANQLKLMGFNKVSEEINLLFRKHAEEDFCGGISYAWIKPDGTVVKLQNLDSHEDFADQYLESESVRQELGIDTLKYEKAVEGFDYSMQTLLAEAGWLRVSNPFNIDISTVPIPLEQSISYIKMLTNCIKKHRLDPEKETIYYGIMSPGNYSFNRDTVAEFISKNMPNEAEEFFYEAFFG